jgi:hypothetical protein
MSGKTKRSNKSKMLRDHPRQQKWRDQKEDTGLKQVNFWLSVEDKDILHDLSSAASVTHGEIVGLMCQFAFMEKKSEFLRFCGKKKNDVVGQEDKPQP